MLATWTPSICKVLWALSPYLCSHVLATFFFDVYVCLMHWMLLWHSDDVSWFMWMSLMAFSSWLLKCDCRRWSCSAIWYMLKNGILDQTKNLINLINLIKSNLITSLEICDGSKVTSSGKCARWLQTTWLGTNGWYKLIWMNMRSERQMLRGQHFASMSVSPNVSWNPVHLARVDTRPGLPKPCFVIRYFFTNSWHRFPPGSFFFGCTSIFARGGIFDHK